MRRASLASFAAETYPFPRGSGSSISANGSLIYRPNGTSGGNVVTQWSDVKAALAAANGAIDVFVDDSAQSPAVIPGSSGTTNFMGAGRLLSYRSNSNNPVVMQIDDGAVLQDVRELIGPMTVNCQCITTGAFGFPQDGAVFRLFGDVLISMLPGAVHGAFVVPDSHELTVESLLRVGFFGQPVFELLGSAQLVLFVFMGAVSTQNFIKGGVAATYQLIHDASIDETSTNLNKNVPSLLGTTSTLRIDNAAGAQPAQGTTLQRPPAPQQGQMYYDTTISKPVWFFAGWKDAAGAPA